MFSKVERNEMSEDDAADRLWAQPLSFPTRGANKFLQNQTLGLELLLPLLAIHASLVLMGRYTDLVSF